MAIKISKHKSKKNFYTKDEVFLSYNSFESKFSYSLTDKTFYYRDPVKNSTLKAYKHTENMFLDKTYNAILIPPSPLNIDRAQFISKFKEDWYRCAEIDQDEGLDLEDRHLLNIFEHKNLKHVEIDPHAAHLTWVWGDNYKFTVVSCVNYSKNLAKTPDNNFILLPKNLTKQQQLDCILSVDKNIPTEVEKATQNSDIYSPSVYLENCKVTRFPYNNQIKFFVNFRLNAIGLDLNHNLTLLDKHNPSHIKKNWIKHENHQ